jgi:hypothetical protein
MIFESKYSDDIIKYLNKKIITDNENIVPIQSNNFFMKLTDSIKDIYSKTNVEADLKKISCKNKPFDKNNDLLNDIEFISKKTINYISNKLKYLTIYTYENNKINYFTKEYVKLNNIPDVIIHMFRLIRIMKKLFGRDNFSQTVFYYECDLSKKMPIGKEKAYNKAYNKDYNKTNIEIGVDNINSAVTFVTPTQNGNIILYRKEEVLKVLIHELIHSNLSDLNLIKSNDKKDDFNKLFCTNYVIEINEAYTESMATVIYLIYKSIYKNIDLNTLFKNEMKYSNYICTQIFKFYNIKSINDIMKKNINEQCKSFFPQGSNLFSYYILKNILLRNHIEYGHCLEHGLKLYKIKNQHIISNIIDIITKHIRDFDIQVLNQYSHTKKTKYLRMCL